MASAFHGAVDAHVAILGAQCGPGGIMNFNVGSGEKKHKPEPFSTVPFAPDPDFVDRPEIIAWLRDKCAGAGARAALVGLGGVGKSQLALHYVHSVREADPKTYVFWVHASTRARFEEAYRGIADRLQLPGRSDPKANVLRLVSDWLQDEASGQWIMVVDNADDVNTSSEQVEVDPSIQASMTAFLPQNRGAVLVTSRNKDAAFELVGGYNRMREVPTMTEQEGLRLLGNKLLDPPERERALELLRELDYIPLAIGQAAAYIGRRAGMTVARYVEEFRKSNKKQESLLRWNMIDLRRDASASNSVVTTWQISFDQIQKERRSAVELLSLMSFFNPQEISLSTLREFYRIPEVKEEEDEDVDSTFEKDLDILQAFSLVSVTENAATCEMHALVQFCTRVWLMSTGSIGDYEVTFLVLMMSEFQDLTKGQQLLPHVEPLFDSEPAAEGARMVWALLLTWVATYLYRRGSFSTARGLAEKALFTTRDLFGPDHRLTLISIEVLVAVLFAQGEFERAEDLNHRSLANSLTQFGEEGYLTLVSTNNRAELLQAQGRYREAENVWRLILKGRSKLGERHPDVFRTMEKIAQVLFRQGNYEEAETLGRQALDGLKKELGNEHHDTMATASNLALALDHQGKHEEAQKLSQHVLEVLRRDFGEHHFGTLAQTTNTAVNLQCQGKYKEAEALLRQALEGYKKFGEQHPWTLTCMSNLAMVLQDQARYDEAEELQGQTLMAQINVLGEYHPDTMSSGHRLAYIWHLMGCYKVAAPLYRAVLKGMGKYLGPDHPDTKACCLNFIFLRLQMLPVKAEQDSESSDEEMERIATVLDEVCRLAYP